MSRMTSAHVAATAALLISMAACACELHRPLQVHGKSLGGLRREAAARACDLRRRLRRAGRDPVKSYQDCMRQHGWKFLHETRDKDTVSGGFDSNVKRKPGHYIDHDDGMDCQNFGGAAVCTPPDGTVHYFDPEQGLPCTRTGIVSICSRCGQVPRAPLEPSHCRNDQPVGRADRSENNGRSLAGSRTRYPADLVSASLHPACLACRCRAVCRGIVSELRARPQSGTFLDPARHAQSAMAADNR